MPTCEPDPALARAQGPLTPRLPATSSAQGCDVTRRAANGNAVYWQAARAVAAKKEVSWGCSDGGGLEPTAASAATCASGTAAAAAGSGAGVAAGVEKERVSRRCRNTSNSGREVFRRAEPPSPLRTVPPQAQTAGLGSPQALDWLLSGRALRAGLWVFLDLGLPSNSGRRPEDREHPRPGHFVVAQAVSWL